MPTNIFGSQVQNSGISSQTFGSAGAGVSDIFSGFAELEQSQGAAAEAQQYGLACRLCRRRGAIFPDVDCY